MNFEEYLELADAKWRCAGCGSPVVGVPVQHSSKRYCSVQCKDKRVNQKWGAVYFIQEEGGSQLNKIGHTSGVDPVEAVRRRLDSLQTGNPHRLKILAILGTPRPQRTESSLHERFKSTRKVGEWFQPTPELMSYIRCLQTAPPTQPEDTP